MFGPEEVLYDFRRCDPELWGLVPRATEQLFEGLRNGPDDTTYLLQVSYIEVYNDRLNDLLGGKQNCPLRETPKGILVEGLGHEVVTSVAEVMAALQRGSDKRMADAARSKPPSTQSPWSARLRPRRR